MGNYQDYTEHYDKKFTRQVEDKYTAKMEIRELQSQNRELKAKLQVADFACTFGKEAIDLCEKKYDVLIVKNKNLKIQNKALIQLKSFYCNRCDKTKTDCCTNSDIVQYEDVTKKLVEQNAELTKNLQFHIKDKEALTAELGWRTIKFDLDYADLLKKNDALTQANQELRVNYLDFTELVKKNDALTQANVRLETEKDVLKTTNADYISQLSQYNLYQRI
jgi:hypothetical protein